MNHNFTHEARQREDGAARQCRVVSTGALRACETHIAFILDRSGSMDTIAKEAMSYSCQAVSESRNRSTPKKTS